MQTIYIPNLFPILVNKDVNNPFSDKELSNHSSNKNKGQLTRQEML